MKDLYVIDRSWEWPDYVDLVLLRPPEEFVGVPEGEARGTPTNSKGGGAVPNPHSQDTTRIYLT